MRKYLLVKLQTVSSLSFQHIIANEANLSCQALSCQLNKHSHLRNSLPRYSNICCYGHVWTHLICIHWSLLLAFSPLESYSKAKETSFFYTSDLSLCQGMMPTISAHSLCTLVALNKAQRVVQVTLCGLSDSFKGTVTWKKLQCFFVAKPTYSYNHLQVKWTKNQSKSFCCVWITSSHKFALQSVQRTKKENKQKTSEENLRKSNTGGICCIFQDEQKYHCLHYLIVRMHPIFDSVECKVSLSVVLGIKPDSVKRTASVIYRAWHKTTFICCFICFLSAAKDNIHHLNQDCSVTFLLYPLKYV